MRKGVIATIIAVIALLAIGGVLVTNNKDNKKSSGTTSSTSTTQEPSENMNMTPPPTDASAPPPSNTATDKVTISNFAFSPAEITVKKGTTVTWTNSDSVSHTVTGNNGGPDSELIGNGETYSFTFNTVGTFSYHCKPHPQMTGKVTVVD